MKDLMIALMSWASAHTGLAVPESLPELRHESYCTIQQIVRAGLICSTDSGPVAAYDFRTSTIYLPDDWRGDDIYHLSALLHELIHHMQAEAGMTMTGSCSGKHVERPAYAAQMDWLAAAGLDPYRVMGIDEFYLRFRTSCEIHH
jgi:hypothetical protein